MIDWFTVIAQLINFVVLVGLLKYFLYGRIIAAMAQREQKIANLVDEAQRERDRAAEERTATEQKNRQLDEQREKLLAQIRQEVETHRQELTAKVHDEVDQRQARWAEAIREETDAFLRGLRQRVGEEVCTIARRALTDLADADLERRVSEKFLARVEQLGDPQRREVIAALRESDHTAVVQSAFQMPEELRQEIIGVLRQQLLDDLEVRFEPSPDVLCGVALRTRTHKLAWELSDYLTGLEQQLRQMLEEETHAKKTRHGEPAMK